MRFNEVSNKILGDYKRKAGADASAADKAGDTERGNKRFRGIVKATKKEFDNDAKKHHSVKETTDPVSIPEQSSDIKVPTEDGITMQDIRLVAGEGPLTKKTVHQAIAVIRKQRKQQSVAEGEITEEMIADKLRKDLEVFNRGQKKDRELSSKPRDREIQKKAK